LQKNYQYIAAELKNSGVGDAPKKAVDFFVLKKAFLCGTMVKTLLRLE